MKSVIRNLDITSILSGIFGVAMATQIKEWLSIILTIISVISLSVSCVFRIIDKIKQAQSKDSDGGEKITKKEIDEMVDDVSKTIDTIDKTINKKEGE